MSPLHFLRDDNDFISPSSFIVLFYVVIELRKVFHWGWGCDEAVEAVSGSTGMPLYVLV